MINNHICCFSFISLIYSQIFIIKIKNIIIDVELFYNLRINYKISKYENDNHEFIYKGIF